MFGGEPEKIFLDIELRRIDWERVFGEDAKGRFPKSSGEEDVRVSDDACGKR